jgi:hypothetical protein
VIRQCDADDGDRTDKRRGAVPSQQHGQRDPEQAGVDEIHRLEGHHRLTDERIQRRVQPHDQRPKPGVHGSGRPSVAQHARVIHAVPAGAAADLETPGGHVQRDEHRQGHETERDVPREIGG